MNRYDKPFQEQRSIEALRSIICKLLEYGYLNYFSNHHDELEGRTVVAMTVHHELPNPTLTSDFPIFLQQFHYDATYGPSKVLRTVTGLVGCNFYAFLAQKLLRSSLEKFPAYKEKLT